MTDAGGDGAQIAPYCVRLQDLSADEESLRQKLHLLQDLKLAQLKELGRIELSGRQWYSGCLC